MANVIKSIQSFTIALSAVSSATQTITSVVVANTIVLFGGSTTNVSTNNYERINCRVALTNATTLTVTRGSNTGNCNVDVTVIEFASGVNSIQSGTVSLSTAQASNTATISAVGANAFVIWLGSEWVSGGTMTAGAAATSVVLTNSTTVTAAVGATGNAFTVGFMVVDLNSTIINTVQAKAHTDATSATSYTDTITSVNMSLTLLIYNGCTDVGAVAIEHVAHTIQLTSATVVTLTRVGTGTNSRTVNYTAVQFKQSVIKSLQRGTTAFSAASTVNQAVTAVAAGQAAANTCNFRCATASTADIALMMMRLTTTTNIQERLGAAGTITASWELIEFSLGANGGGIMAGL